MSTPTGCNQYKHAPGCGHPGATGGPAEVAGIDLTPTPSPAQAWQDANELIDRLRAPLRDLAADIDDQILARDVRDTLPEAASFKVEPYDDGNGPDAYVTAYDADGEEIDGYIAPVVPERLKWEDEYTVKVADYLDMDIAARAEQAREQVASAAIDPSWQHLVLSPGVVRDQISWEGGGDLTDAEKDEVVRRFMDATHPDAAVGDVEEKRREYADAFHGEVADLVEQVRDERDDA